MIIIGVLALGGHGLGYLSEKPGTGSSEDGNSQRSVTQMNGMILRLFAIIAGKDA